LYDDNDNLFVRCADFGRLWNKMSDWLGYEFVGRGFIMDHRNQFCVLGSLSERDNIVMSIIWASIVWVI